MKNWIRTATAQNSTRRRSALPRFRGQIEQLEARTVLSASIGGAATDFEAPAAGLWESAYAQTDLQQRFSPNVSGIAPRDTAALADAGYFQNVFQNDLSRLDRPPRGPNRPASNGFLPAQHEYWIVIVTIHVPSNGLQSTSSQTPNTSPEPSLPPLSSPLGLTNSNGNPQDSNSSQPSLTPVPPALPYLSLFGTTSLSTEFVGGSSTSSLDVREAAFQSYSSESLLLATSLDESRESSSDDRLSDLSDEEPDELSENNALAGSEEFSVPFESLRSELGAIDAVLAELHSIDGHAEKQQSDATTERRQQDEAFLPNDTADVFSADVQYAQPAANDRAQGGMVLLETSGDANRCAYDLTAVFAPTLDVQADAPLGVEVSVGVYQALDIGGTELRPSGTNASAPSAAVVRPSVSVENVPAKEGERAS